MMDGPMREVPFARPTSALFLLLLSSAACMEHDREQRRTDAALSITAPSPHSVTTQRVSLRSLADGRTIRGSTAILERRSESLTVRVRTRSLQAGESVDVFWAVFNDPAACENPNSLTGALCTPPDLFIAATGGSLHYVATLAADARGRLTYSAVLHTGSAAGCVGDPFPCTTLTDPAGAEVHSPMFVPEGGPGRQAAQFLPN